MEEIILVTICLTVCAIYLRGSESGAWNGVALELQLQDVSTVDINTVSQYQRVAGDSLCVTAA